MKKFAILAAGVALSLAVAAPAFADRDTNGGISVSNSDTTLTNSIMTFANSGFNLTTGGSSHGYDEEHHGSVAGDITTGGTVSSSATVHNLVNFTQLNCGCTGHDGSVSVSNEDTSVSNHVFTFANSGFNKSGAGDITTGSNVGAGALVTNEVNTTIFGTIN